MPGEQVTLNWSVERAESATLTPDIGAITLSGNTNVSPEQETIYTLTTTGPGGTVTASAAVAVTTPIEITVLCPVQGDQIDRSNVLVRGTFTNTSGADTGIMVNGVTALVFGNHFAANHVPLEAGTNTIAVMAVDSQGHKAKRIQTVQADPSGQSIAVRTVPEAALALYEGKLQIKAPAQILSSSMLVYNSADVACDLSGTGPYPLTISEPGLYRLSVSSTLADGRTLGDETAVLVYDAGQLDALLQAKYRIRRDEIHQGQTYTITYHIYFNCSEDGVWRIHRF